VESNYGGVILEFGAQELKLKLEAMLHVEEGQPGEWHFVDYREN
jgi:hypothetical protein